MSVTPMRANNLTQFRPFLRAAILLMGILPGVAGAVGPHDRTNISDSLIHRARTALARNQLDSAEAMFLEALETDSRSLPAQIGLGRVELAREDWSDAQSLFEDALEIDESNLEARYYAGIAAREAGTQVALIFRTARWSTAEDHLTYVVGRDSLYRDVIYQLALLERYRGELERALDLAYRQLAVTPGLPSAEIGLYNLYRFILADLSPTEALQLLKRHPTAESLYFSAELLRRVNQPGDAEKIVRQMMPSPGAVPVQALLLTLTRIGVEWGNADSAGQLYWQAVDRIGTSLGAALIFEDLKYILTDAELDEYFTLSSDRKKQAFFRAFWARRNPTPASASNPRLIEHYRRLRAAETEFEYYGFRSPFNDPERFKTFTFPRSAALNHEYNDKGQILIRHGLPDVLRRTINDVEVWVYFEREDSPQRIFSFALRNAVGNNWRLVSFPDSRELLEELAIYDARYRDLLMADPLTRLGREGAVIDQSRIDVQEALATDRHTWREETVALSVPGSIDAFRSDEGRTLLDISYGIQVDEIVRGLPAGASTASVEVGVDISTPKGVRRTARTDTLSLPLSGESARSYTGLFRSVVAPDSLVIALHVRPLGTSMLGGWRQALQVRDFRGEGLMVSDIQFLLPSSREPAIEIEGVKVMQSPFDRVPRADPLMTYLHAYNLTQDVWGKTLYRVEYLLAPADADPGEDERVILEETISGSSPFEARFKMLDLRAVDAGEYNLIVQVTDTKRTRTARVRRYLEVLE